MSLYKAPITGILEAIAKQNKVTLVESEYTYGNPTGIGSSGTINSMMSITAKTEQSAYDGTVNVNYSRLSLDTLSTMLVQPLLIHNCTTLNDVVVYLNSAHGLNLTLEELQDTTPELTAGVGHIWLRARTTSRGWIGNVRLEIAKGKIPLTQYVTNTAVGKLPYPHADTRKPFAEMYSYWRDCTSAADTLSTILVDETDLSLVAIVLSDITDDTWVTDAIDRHSLLGATVIYNGLATGNTIHNDVYDNLLVIELSESCQALAGKLYLHYNDEVL